MQEGVRQWRREALLVLLKREPGQSAGQLAEAFSVACMGEDVPAHVWRDMTPPAVAGVLRQLGNAGMARQADMQRNPRAGREEPRWSVVDPASIADELPPFAPEPSSEETPADSPGRAPARVVASGEETAIALQAAFDEIAGMRIRHQRELDVLMQRLRERLGHLLDP